MISRQLNSEPSVKILLFLLVVRSSMRCIEERHESDHVWTLRCVVKDLRGLFFELLNHPVCVHDVRDMK